MPNFASRSREQVQRPAINRGAAHDLVAGCEAAPISAVVVAAWPLESTSAASAPFEPRDLLLDREHRRIRVARVEELRRFPLVVRAHLGGVLEEERRGFVDRRGERLGVVAGAFAADQFSGWFHERSRGTIGLRPRGSPAAAPASAAAVRHLGTRGTILPALYSWMLRPAPPFPGWTASMRSPPAPTTGSMNWR